jgi:hypothetical protein
VQNAPEGHGGIVGQMVIVHVDPLGPQLPGVGEEGGGTDGAGVVEGTDPPQPGI